MLSIDLFDFDLPSSQIAQYPSEKRDESKLLVVDRKAKTIKHAIFKDILDYLPPKAGLIRNTVSVLKARLRANLETGGNVECFLLHPSANTMEWWCLLKPAKKIPIGKTFGVTGLFQGTVREKTKDGLCLVSFNLQKHTCVYELSQEWGEVPLPQYISRKPEDSLDPSRYQTIYANPSEKGACAAPTAGLHFTQDLLHTLSQNNIKFFDLILRVGLGTFRPIKTQNVQDHPIHTESYTLPLSTAQFLNAPNGSPRIAVGTTSVRTIEHFLRNSPNLTEAHIHSQANIYIYPPFNFLGVDGLITNFHLPRSTLLCLVSAFLTPGSTSGILWLKEIYQEAIAHKYRFFSYGDAMLIL